MIYLLIFMIAMCAMLLQGIVVSYLWGLFVVPVFHIPHIPQLYAVGIVLLVSLFVADRPQDDPLDALFDAIWGCIVPSVAAFFGFLLTLFI